MANRDGAAADVAGLIADLKRRVEALETSTRLSNSSMHGGPLLVYSPDDPETVRSTIGQQPDGTITVVDSNGPPPPMPTQPTIEVRPGALVVTWDGAFAAGAPAPADWDHVEVHVSTVSGYETSDATEITTLHSAKGGSVTLALDPVAQYVRLQAVSTSGTESDATPEVAATPDPPATGGDGVTTYYENEEPIGLGLDDVGDLWFDTNDGNHQYRWDGDSWVSVRDAGISAAAAAAADAIADAAAALTAAEAAQATADGAIRTFYAAEPPWANGSGTPPEVVGDLWFDTDTNQAYRWNGTTWEVIQDNAIAAALAAAQNAQTTADGKITAYYQDTAPVTGEVGDLWYDTNDQNKPYYCSATGPVTWTPVRDGAIADAQAVADAADAAAAAALVAAQTAQTTADGKAVAYFQDNAPGGLAAGDVGDLWFDTNDGNKMYRWTGSAWTVAQDQAITTALNNAAAANTAAGNAQATANTKITTLYQATPPSSTGRTAGDLWVDTDAGNLLSRWSGSEWVAIPVGAGAISPGAVSSDEIATDGLAPLLSPVPTVVGNIGSLLVRWPAITNADPVQYEVHLSTTSGFTPDATTLLRTVVETGITIRTRMGVDEQGNPAEVRLDPFVFYYVKIKAKDADGAAAASPQAFGMISQVEDGDIAANAVNADNIVGNSIHGGLLAAVIALVSRISTGVMDEDPESPTYGQIIGQRVDIDQQGIRLLTALGKLLINLPTDPDQRPLVDADLIARALSVIEGASFESTNNVVETDAGFTLASAISPPTSTPNPFVTWESVPLERPVGSGTLGNFALNPTDVTGIFPDPLGGFIVLQRRANGTRYWWYNYDGTLRNLPGFTDMPDWEVYGTVRRANGLTYDLFRFTPNGKWYIVWNNGGEFWFNEYTPLNPNRTPTLGLQGDVLVIAESDTNNRLRVRTVEVQTTTNYGPITVLTGSIASATKLMAGSPDFIWGGSFDYGTGRWVTAHHAVNFDIWVLDTSWNWQVNEQWPSPTTRMGTLWDGGNFWSLGADGTMYKYSTNKWTTEPSAWWLALSAYDPAGPYETTPGLMRVVNMKRRAQLEVGIPDLSTQWRLYATRSATQPAASALKLQATGSGDSHLITALNLAGAAPPVSSNFPGATPAWLKSEVNHSDGNPAYIVRGDATGRWLHGSTGYFVRRTSDLTRGNTATLAPDDQLFFDVAANTNYLVEVVAWVTAGASAGGIKFAWALPTGGSWSMGGQGPTIGSGPTGGVGGQWDVQIGSLNTPLSFGTPAGITSFTTLRGYLYIGNTAGLATLRWAQNVAQPTNTTTLKSWSFVRAERLP
jgi:hypothetical protein